MTHTIHHRWLFLWRERRHLNRLRSLEYELGCYTARVQEWRRWMLDNEITAEILHAYMDDVGREASLRIEHQVALERWQAASCPSTIPLGEFDIQLEARKA